MVHRGLILLCFGLLVTEFCFIDDTRHLSENQGGRLFTSYQELVGGANRLVENHTLRTAAMSPNAAELHTNYVYVIYILGLLLTDRLILL